jgi:hypothetical protein
METRIQVSVRPSAKWSFISAVNNDQIAKKCLLSSPDVQAASEVLLQRGYSSLAVAYNRAIEAARNDVLVFAHQDMYLPDGWATSVHDAIRVLSTTDPDWGVLGAWGVAASGERAGFTYDGGWRTVLGQPFSGGREVGSLDESLLIFRKSSGIRFDPRIPGFHMYGTDICQESIRQGRKCYAIAAFCIHNTSQYRLLPWAFWQAYFAMRRKWAGQLPIPTTCTTITRMCWPMVRWNVVRAFNLATGRDKQPLKRVEDPITLYQEVLQSGALPAPG